MSGTNEAIKTFCLARQAQRTEDVLSRQAKYINCLTSVATSILESNVCITYLLSCSSEESDIPSQVDGTGDSPPRQKAKSDGRGDRPPTAGRRPITPIDMSSREGSRSATSTPHSSRSIFRPEATSDPRSRHSGRSGDSRQHPYRPSSRTGEPRDPASTPSFRTGEPRDPPSRPSSRAEVRSTGQAKSRTGSREASGSGGARPKPSSG